MPNDKRPFPYYDFPGSVIDFMEIAGQLRPGRFDCRRAALYTGLQCEELAEKIERLWQTVGERASSSNEILLRQLAFRLRECSTDFKMGLHDSLVQAADHDKLIDDDFDLAWVSIGALEATAADAPGALAHGIESNMSKFPGGVCTRDANGKVVKPVGWQEPDFTPFCDPTRGID